MTSHNENLAMQTPNLSDEKFAALAAMFPNAVTETVDENGAVVRAIDADVLRQEINTHVVQGKEERYQFTWPDKKKSILLANAPIAATLRPCREESVDFDTTENLYIEGDNLDVLKLLRETYLNKVKMIYIDPPYNTGNDFVYNDDFSEDTDGFLSRDGQYDEDGNRMVKNLDSNGRFHTDWLNMIYPRLRVARDLLTDDGVIFISIDDGEVENLKKICNEIFGAENFISILSVENNPKGRKNSSFVSVSSEYCVIYAKHKDSSYFIENVPKKASDMMQDEDGNYVHGSGKRVLVGENSFNNYVTKIESEKNYSVYFRLHDRQLRIRKENYGIVDQALIDEGYVKYYSFNNGRLVENTYTESKFKDLYERRALEFSTDKIYEKNFSDTIRIKSQLVNREYEAIVRGQKKKYSMELTTTGAGTYIKNLFCASEAPFPASKNVGYLKVLISLFENEPFTILDFFSGSATTADAVMQLNAEDGGKRKFIMVQLPELTDESSEAYKAGYNNICEIGKERIRRAGKKVVDDLHFPNKTKNGNELLTYGYAGIRKIGEEYSIKNAVLLDQSFGNVETNEIIREEYSKLNGKDKYRFDPNALDIGFRVLKLDSSNMKDVYYTPDEYAMMDFAIDGFADNIKEDRSDEDLLFQVMLDLGVPLSAKIKKDGDVFYVNDNYLIACFTKVDTELLKEIAKQKPYYAVFRDSSFANDSAMVNFEQVFKTYSPDTIRRVL